MLPSHDLLKPTLLSAAGNNTKQTTTTHFCRGGLDFIIKEVNDWLKYTLFDIPHNSIDLFHWRTFWHLSGHVTVSCQSLEESFQLFCIQNPLHNVISTSAVVLPENQKHSLSIVWHRRKFPFLNHGVSVSAKCPVVERKVMSISNGFVSRHARGTPKCDAAAINECSRHAFPPALTEPLQHGIHHIREPRFLLKRHSSCCSLVPPLAPPWCISSSLSTPALSLSRSLPWQLHSFHFALLS